MAIKDWPADERPREKLLLKGSGALSDAELLAIFLRTGVKGKTAVDLARELLEEFGGLRPLLESHREGFCRGKGLGNAKFAQLQAVLEMARRHLFEPLKRGSVISSSNDSEAFLRAKLRSYPYEVFACLFLDNKNRMIAFEEMFRGTVNYASVHPREVVKRALELNAAALIVAHNHPSGDAEPSRSDELITDKLQQALSLVDVRLLDHLVVGDQECVSMADQGLFC